jgi:hypothetical protein
MPKYRVTMRKQIDGASNVVTVFVDKSNAKAAYDDAIAGAIIIFGPLDPSKPYIISVVEEPTA